MNMKLFRNGGFFKAALALTLLAGMSGSVWAYESFPGETGGDLSGMIKLKWEVPVIQPHKIILDSKFCGELVAGDINVVIPSTHGLQNIVISVEGFSQGGKHSPSTIPLDNAKSRFQPRAIAAMVGDSYEVKNSDPILHNTHLKLDDLTILNVALPASGRNVKKPLTQAGAIPVRCNAHTFMKRNILVFDHPYFAMTDHESSYRITNGPPGKYKLKIWQDGTPVKEEEVSIGPSEKIDLSVELTTK
jgi:hypothetical protein